MSFNGYGKMNSDDVGIYLQLKTDAIITAVPLLYIAPKPSRHDTQQIPVVRSLGLCRRSNNQVFLGGFGSLQGFFKGMAVVSGHVGGEDNQRYGQRGVHLQYCVYSASQRSLNEGPPNSSSVAV